MLVSFPIYKYTGKDKFGISKLDNFPSILNFDLKHKINWEFSNLNIGDCKLIDFNNQNKTILNYISVKFKFEGFQHIKKTRFQNLQNIHTKKNCQLSIENRSFILKVVY